MHNDVLCLSHFDIFFLSTASIIMAVCKLEASYNDNTRKNTWKYQKVTYYNGESPINRGEQTETRAQCFSSTILLLQCSKHYYIHTFIISKYRLIYFINITNYKNILLLSSILLLGT